MALFAILFYLVCLPLDAAVFDRTCPANPEISNSAALVAGFGNTPLGKEAPTTNPSWFLLILGGFSLLYGLGGFGWLANPCFAFVCVLLYKREVAPARASALASLILSATSLHATNHLYLAGDEGGVCRISAIAAGPGFWLWLLSIFLLFLSTLIAQNRANELVVAE